MASLACEDLLLDWALYALMFRRFPEGFAYTCGKCCASEDWVYIFIYFIMLLYAHPGLGHLFLLYIYKYIRVCVCSRYTHSIFGPDAATPHTEQTKKWFKYCIEWIGKFCHFLYWHRIPGDSPSVRCSTDWCSSVVKSKWLPMLDKRTIFPQFPINFHFPALSLYYIILLCIMIFPLVVV